MKRVFCFVAAAVTASAVIMSGCSDFDFNPVGKWTLSENNLYVGDDLVDHMDKGSFIYETNYVMEKCGTGYILVSGERMRDFTYEYEKNSVTIHINEKGQAVVDLKLDVSDDGKTLTRADMQRYLDEDGNNVVCREEYVFERE